MAPFIRLGRGRLGQSPRGRGRLRSVSRFRGGTAYGRKTYNARTKTVASPPSFRSAWKKGQRCIIPAEAIF
ncbi:SOS response-associated peptidase family protein [Variovorax sp. AB1(2024)]|uniref:SOS response-associated peptidase family protein n=1 Tax=Variovorax sp. AB1(2024) TaxID=3132214 RepID=UPI0038F8A369